ncbi:ribonuclease II, chloroplastic/mitochondrial isoform X1 [Pistacia vera]|uniref:ribonuclease II, chloroplastic/mitochondrial isoform X1 n=2 Tax=Pistacia vera TaxID=55513 RepID=UPI001262E30E|nr:ribonuclease II, chloroplastic/mitochondrial isoform X1 [Pistacia vera]XP_031251388.1 ribonuclease II, chloroplastic/mitochondrial isoform X1 [Pistacia vera]XP_031251389.1 ribonuclease II, chloroplastic/mitochondrial isoform X1 [Pistacia vera]XP_031251390.1 ribonuclease II, chloroplastic/mitochondrial isoform X1 [Pistacia vera]XP_031251391.1 ribonuclease II, chloroplastic/mitochondrial isoform X1 [Pistacia vera]XP_031251392.1 ribonuclease II, chloroplastic/mitochondrial isoform X1 [Pistacia
MIMAVRVVNTCSIVRSTTSPPVAAFQCRFYHFRTLQLRCHSKSGFRFPIFSSEQQFLSHAGFRSCSVHSLVDSVMKELKTMRKRKRVSAKVGLSGGELLVKKLENQVLQKGLLLEFKKDSDRILLAVAQRPDGKKNWMVSDQNGVSCSIKPQQITFIVPGVENFDHSEISQFLQKAQDNLDPALLEFAWVELLEKNKSVTAEELAEMTFGSAEPLESYCAHLLLSKDEIYFSVLATKGSRSIYAPRSTAQVEELLRRKLAKEAAEKELQEFVQQLMSAKAMPAHAKPLKSSWKVEEKVQYKIESLEAYAIDACKDDDQKKTAGIILKAMGLAKTASSAVNLLIDIGYFPVHVNLEVLKFNIHTDHSEEIISAAESVLVDSPDEDELNRKDLTHLKVYAIDVDEADELDDALSATRLQDGRIKVYIHVADPTRYVQPGSMLDKDAMRRGTSVFLPTATYPMFPDKLAMQGMSLKQGEVCNAVTVSVVLHSDGGIAEYSVENSIIKPTYMLTYESATELLHLNLEEERELRLLSEAAALRLQWRRRQGAVDTVTLETRIKVSNPEDPEPLINLYVEDQAHPAMRLVSEMMILCGETIATYGSCNNIPLPYRGQPQSNIDVSAFAHLPEGPVRSSAIVKIMRAAEIDFRKPIRHGVLGLPGYVQFTSPIRRYLDLLAHYQVKAFLRGESPPLSCGQLEGMASIVNMHTRVARRLSSSSLRYWIIEFLRRQPKDKRYSALVLRFIKDRTAALLLVEVGFQASASVSVGTQIGDEIEVQVEEAHPRDDVVYLKEAIR